MFKNTLDSKDTYIDKNGIELVDLGISIFDTKFIYSGITCNIYKGFDGLNMRMDNLSNALYSTEDYTEMLLKYNDIQNPFSVDESSTFIVPSIVDITKNVTQPTYVTRQNQENLVRNYHKYIDKSKLPDTTGSEKNDMSIDSAEPSIQLQEPNITDVGTSAITEIGNRLYFGANSGLCAADGITTTELFNKVIKANL